MGSERRPEILPGEDVPSWLHTDEVIPPEPRLASELLGCEDGPALVRAGMGQQHEARLDDAYPGVGVQRHLCPGEQRRLCAQEVLKSGLSGSLLLWWWLLRGSLPILH